MKSLILGKGRFFDSCTDSLEVGIGIVFVTLLICGCETTPPEPQTVETLMEQVRGDQLRWDMFGDRWVDHEPWFYEDKRAQTYAIKELQKLAPSVRAFVPELIALFNETDDLVTDDT